MFLMIRFSSVYHNLKCRTVELSSLKNEPFISAEGAGPLSQSGPCCTTMFIQ